MYKSPITTPFAGTDELILNDEMTFNPSVSLANALDCVSTGTHPKLHLS
jgi:hypothetical protein